VVGLAASGLMSSILAIHPGPPGLAYRFRGVSSAQITNRLRAITTIPQTG
jgi:hypothetical protein